MENIVLIIALCASFLFAMAAGYLRFRYERKKDRIVAAVFSLIFALLCLVGIIISKLNKPDSCENYDKANSIYSEMQRLKEEQFAAPYEPAKLRRNNHGQYGYKNAYHSLRVAFFGDCRRIFCSPCEKDRKIRHACNLGDFCGALLRGDNPCGAVDDIQIKTPLRTGACVAKQSGLPGLFFFVK